MGKRGPAPTPTATLKLRGSRRAAGRTSEPPAVDGTPPRPPGLCAEANAEWERICPLLERMGVLAETDLAVIAGYCQQWGRWCQAEAALAKTRAARTTIQYRRLAITADAAFGAMLRAAARLGLSPADRAGVSAAGKPESDDLADLIHRRGRKAHAS